MIHSVRFTCVLDTNVIYPIDIRDLLFWFAHYDLFTPKWSKHIFDEWLDVMLRKGISRKEAEKRVRKANLAFPDALVLNYEYLIDALQLPDPKDRQVDSTPKCESYGLKLFIKTCKGDLKSSFFLGRLLNLLAISANWFGVTFVKSAFFGRYCLISLLVYSLRPLCQAA